MAYKLTIFVLLAVGIAAQDPIPIDFEKIAKRLAPTGEVPSVVASIPPEFHRWALGSLERMSKADIDAVWGGVLNGSRPSRIVAVAAVVCGEQVKSDSAQALFRELRACEWLVGGAEAQRSAAGLTGEKASHWLLEVEGAARLRRHMLFADLLRRFPNASETMRALAFDSDADALADEVVDAALHNLGKQVTARQRLARVRRCLRAADLDGARQHLALVAGSVQPDRVELREQYVVSTELRARQIERAAELLAAAQKHPDDVIAALRCDMALGRDGIEDTCQKLVAAKVEHSLPHVLLAQRSIANGEHQAARKHLDRAMSLPGHGLFLGVTRWVLHGGQLLAKGDSLSDQERVALVGIFDELGEQLTAHSKEGAELFTMLRLADWPMKPQMSVLARLAERAAESDVLPATAEAFIMILAGALAAENHSLGVTLLQRDIPEAVRRRPLVMRQRASVATINALREQTEAGDAIAARLAKEHRDLSGDNEFVGYLEAVRAWARATTAEQREAVQTKLAALRPNILGEGSWAVASARHVIGVAVGQEVDGDAVARLRGMCPKGPIDESMVPMVIALLHHAHLQSGFRMGQQLLEADLLPVWKLALQAAMATAMQRAQEPVRAASYARLALAGDGWEAPDVGLAHVGVLVRNHFNWSYGFKRDDALLTATLQCELLLMPPMPSRADLKKIVASDKK